MNEDFRDLLTALLEGQVRFLVVGAQALAFHGVPRATGDLDIWIEPTPENGARVWEALFHFGAPVEALGITPADLEKPEMVVQLGLPPRRIDLLTSVSGISFAEAWASRVTNPLGGSPVPFLGREQLIRNKRAAGRLRDLADLEALGETP